MGNNDRNVIHYSFGKDLFKGRYWRYIFRRKKYYLWIEPTDALEPCETNGISAEELEEK